MPPYKKRIITHISGKLLSQYEFEHSLTAYRNLSNSAFAGMLIKTAIQHIDAKPKSEIDRVIKHKGDTRQRIDVSLVGVTLKSFNELKEKLYYDKDSPFARDLIAQALSILKNRRKHNPRKQL